MRRSSKFIARTGITGALYFILTFAVAPIAYGPLQFRVSEALTLLPLLFPEAILGLTLGCFAANIFSPFSWADVIFGTLATLISAILTHLVGVYFLHKKGKEESYSPNSGHSNDKFKIWIACLLGSIPPIFVNALTLPLMWFILEVDFAYWINFLMLLLTQTGTILILGAPLTVSLSKLKFI